MPRALLLVAGLESVGIALPSSGLAENVVRTAEVVADLEYAVLISKTFKRWFIRSLTVHVVLLVLLRLLLAPPYRLHHSLRLEWATMKKLLLLVSACC